MESSEEQIRQTSAKNGSFVVDPCPSGKGFPPKPVALCLIYTRHWVRAEGLKFSYSKGAIRMLKTEVRKEKSLSVLITVPHNNSYFAWRQGPPLSLLLFPRCVSWFMPASRRNSIPEDMISQHISDFRQHFPNHLFAVLLYPSIPFCYTLGHHELPAFFRRNFETLGNIIKTDNSCSILICLLSFSVLACSIWTWASCTCWVRCWAAFESHTSHRARKKSEEV